MSEEISPAKIKFSRKKDKILIEIHCCIKRFIAGALPASKIEKTESGRREREMKNNKRNQRRKE